jgi:hypothetical protein
MGYLVSQPCKYMVPGRHKRMEEEIDLVVVNPLVTEQRIPDALVWTSAELGGIARAVIGVYGSHTERFSVARLEQTPEILHFASERALDVVARQLGSRDVARILCIPELPASGELRGNTLKLLRNNGINGILSFRTMLQDLINGVDTKRNYEKSDLLQTIRILKNYDLVKSGQMELFGKSGRRTRRDGSPSEPKPDRRDDEPRPA